MSFITFSYKSVKCPTWNEDITLKGKYLLSENHSYEAHFLEAYCPVLENQYSSKKDAAYKYYPFCNHPHCDLLNTFKPVIDTRYDHFQ